MKTHLQTYLFYECVAIHMTKGSGTILLERGDWMRQNPRFAMAQIEVGEGEAFISCEPDDDDASFTPRGEIISLPLPGMDMPGIGDFYRMTVERMVEI